MNATSKNEVAMLAQMSSLPPAQRAAIVLSSDKSRVELAALVRKSASILTVTNIDGRKEAHAAVMLLTNTRTTIRATGKTAREDSTAFSKAVIAEEDVLVAIIEPEEARLRNLRDGFDAIEKARKAAELAAEMARTTKITDALEAIREYGADAAFIDKTAAATQASINSLEAMQITDTIYQERLAEAVELKAITLAQMLDILSVRVAAEAAEVQRLADIAAADKLRTAQAEENARVAAENQRIAAENEVAAQKLAAQQVALELAARQQREQAEAAAKAEEARRAEVARLDQAERDRAAAEAQAKIDAELAKIAAAHQALADEQAAAEQRKADALAAEQMAARVLADHAEALLIDQEFDDHEAAEVARAVEVAPSPIRPVPAPDLLDADDELHPSDSDILDVMLAEFGLTAAEAIERLAKFDFAGAYADLIAEAA